MANLLSAELPSEDEEDIDFVPDEVDEDEIGLKKKNNVKRVRGAAAGAGGGSESLPGEESDEEAAAEPESKRMKKKAITDELWSKLTQGQSMKTQTKNSVNLAALCKPVSKKQKMSNDTSWMRQLGMTAGQSKKSCEGEAEKKALAAAALAAAKSISSEAIKGTVTITETRRFAGQNIEVTREVALDSKEAKKASDVTQKEPPRSSGLDAVLASLAQAKKVSVLDKTKADWKDLKRQDVTLEEELESHKRSGTTYLEKQAFLKQAEVAEYERERDARLGSDVRNRGRL